MCCRVWRPCCRSSACCSASSVVSSAAQIRVHRHLRVHHDVAIGRQVNDEVRAQPAAVRAAHGDLRHEIHVLGHVGRRDAVAQLHLSPRTADLRALERRHERPGLVAQAPDLRAHRIEHLPHLPVRRAPVVLQPRHLVADPLEAVRDRVQGPLDLLGALPELAGRDGAIRGAMRLRLPFDLLGDLPQRVGGDRLQLLGQLPAIARHQRELLLGRGAQLREPALVGGLALSGEPSLVLGVAAGRLQFRAVALGGELQRVRGRPLGLRGDTRGSDRASQARDQDHRQSRGTGHQPGEKQDERHDASPRSITPGSPCRPRSGVVLTRRRCSMVAFLARC